jgi:hypothetical protein
MIECGQNINLYVLHFVCLRRTVHSCSVFFFQDCLLFIAVRDIQLICDVQIVNCDSSSAPGVKTQTQDHEKHKICRCI